MKDEVLNRITAFLSSKLDVDQEDIYLTTSLSDLGLDGDDVLELLVSFFEKFNIEYKGTNYLEFVPDESGFIASTLMSLFKSIRKNQEKEILVKDLVDSLEYKKWVKKI